MLLRLAIIALVPYWLAGCLTRDGLVGAIPASAYIASTASFLAPPLATSMPADKDFTESPAGFGDFCRRFSDQCYLPPGRPTSVALTPVIWQQIQLVNANVNHAIWPQDDLSHYGRAEYWTIPVDGFGDCEDYALTKRRDLARLGIPLGALRIAIVITPTAERHAVLDVVTNQGDLVLDNLADTVLSWNRTEFRWIERQDGLTSANWVSLRSANRMATAGTGREALSIASTNVPQL